MSSLNMKRAIAMQIAFSLHGTPYIWGGDDPVRGFDCSGLQIEILKSVGILPRRGDWTAHGLYSLFRARGCEVETPRAGCLVFYGTIDKIVHVEMLITDDLSIGASGGGSGTKTEADAAQQNAFVKIRPLRPNRVGFMDPFKEDKNVKKSPGQ